MISIGAGIGSRSSSVELRPHSRILGFSPRPLRLPALNGRRREGCDGQSVLSVPPCIARAATPRIGAISRLPLCQVTRHCLPSRFDSNVLKTNDGHTCYPSLENGVRPIRFPAGRRTTPASLTTGPFHFPLAIPESRRSRPASDSLSGGII